MKLLTETQRVLRTIKKLDRSQKLEVLALAAKCVFAEEKPDSGETLAGALDLFQGNVVAQSNVQAGDVPRASMY